MKNFQEVALYGEKSVKCDAGCGKRIKSKKKFWQTISPFNKKADGSIKNSQDVYVELLAECQEWKDSPMICKTCYEVRKSWTDSFGGFWARFECAVSGKPSKDFTPTIHEIKGYTITKDGKSTVVEIEKDKSIDNQYLK